jgi:hypothetical protein
VSTVTAPAAGPTNRASIWAYGVPFAFGFFGQFNILVGGTGAGVAESGGYGYRISDLLCVVALVFLAARALNPRCFISLVIFTLALAAVSFVRILEPTIQNDPRTAILAAHYLLYGFGALYLAAILDQQYSRNGFCWGMIFGLICTIPIFVLEAAGYTSNLVSFGLVPGYYSEYSLNIGDTARYAGLWSHPNEAGHVAALAAPAAAYLYISQRRAIAMYIAAAALLTVFYFTQSRAGLLVGASVLAFALFVGPGGRINILRLLLAAIIISVCIELLSQIEFISSRFQDPGAEGNLAERLNTNFFGLQIALSHPFGLSELDFHSILASATGGVGSPHNGFIFFAAVFGWLPFVVFIAALIKSLSIKSDCDILFALIAVGVALSFLFEELPLSYPFAFVICLIIARVYVQTRIGSGLRQRTPVMNHRRFGLASSEKRFVA